MISNCWLLAYFTGCKYAPGDITAEDTGDMYRSKVTSQNCIPYSVPYSAIQSDLINAYCVHLV